MRFQPKTLTRTVLASGLLLAGASALEADTRDDEVRLLREQIQQLDQKLRVLERKQELKEEEATSAAKKTAKVTINDKGVSIASGDAQNVLRLRGLVQGDSRWFFNDNVSNNDAFVLRRARLIFEGTFSKIFEYQLVPEFGGTSGNGSLTLLDANINVAAAPGYQLRVGRFREPVGLEQLQSDAHAFFAERSLVSQFVPNRDVGVQLAGDILDGRLSYAVGAFNGVADGSSNSNNSETNDDKDVAVRLFAQPFKGGDSALAGLGFGVGASVGHQNAQNGATSTLTGGYRTAGQQTWFSYRNAVAQGDTSRISPQAYYYRGPLGLMAEYVVSKVEAANGLNRQSVRNKAWQLSGGYVLTGENAGFKGVVPRQDFSPDNGTWGAFEVVARVEGADIDDAVFAGGASSLANPNSAASAARGYALGLNWYLSKTVRASFDGFHTDFKYAPNAAPASNSVISRDENAFVTRLQLIF